MEYAAVRFDNTLFDEYQHEDHDLENNEFFVVCIEKDKELCKYVTVAPSRIDALGNVEKETGLPVAPDWDVSGPVMVC